MNKSFINKYLSAKGSSDIRTWQTKKNVIISFFVKGVSIFNNLLLVPLTIDYVSTERYGIWLTVSSVILWLNFFDFGLGNGLRNKLTIAIAKNDIELQKRLISTGYSSLFVFSLILGVGLYVINRYIEWDKVLGVAQIYRSELSDLIGVLFLLFCVQFVLQLINAIFYSFQMAAYVSLNFLIGSLFSLLFILGLKELVQGSLYWLGVAFFGGNLLSLFIFSIIFFVFKKPELLPSIKYASTEISKNILNVGGKFVVIQLAGIIQYQAVNIIISRFFSSLSVTEYNIAYKYFSVLLMVFGIIMTPIWGAVSDAMAKNDYNWIYKIEKQLLKVWLLGLGGAILMFTLSDFMYNLWIGKKILIHWQTSLGVMLYVLSMTFGSIYVNILNGLGRLKTQFYISIVTMIVFIPMCYFFAIYLKLGLIGISVSLVIANVNGLIAAPIELKKLLKDNLLIK